ncbi:MAG: hypothetical protein NUV74_05400 [Candidatus Brocadiaceae bacterium]|nr:hypothetical protein [Candidatus Brocadiaceae bacterium]
MKLTNRANLPQALMKAVSNDGYSQSADISVTQLIDSSLIRHLRKLHQEEIEEDVSDRIWALFGQVVHTILERANTTGMVEQRLYENMDGHSLSGQFDHLENGVLTDWKLTSVWAVVYGKAEWGRQLNVLAYLCRLKKLEVKQLQIIAMMRDWQKSKVEPEGNYPQTQVITIPIEMWTPERQEEYVKERLAVHFNAEPSCSDEQRWKKEDTWAVMKKGRKSALRVLASEPEAIEWKDANGGDEIVKRPGSFTRCENGYCNVRQWCPNYF